MDGLWKLAAPLTAITLTLAACGDGGGEDDGSESESPSPPVFGASATPFPDNPTDDDPTCTPQTYEVQSGDTLSEIALRFHSTVEAIAAASGVDNPNVLVLGQELTIPCPGDPTPTPTPEDGEAPASPTPAP